MLRRRLSFILLLMAIVAVGGLLSRYVPNFDWFASHEHELRQTVHLHPVLSWCVGLGAYFLLSLVPGTAGKSVIVGWMFGFLPACFMVELGLPAAAVVSFLTVRRWFRDAMRWRLPAKVRWLGSRCERNGALSLIVLRISHAPFTLVNYAAGASRIPLFTFWWTTHLGILPGTIVFTYAGASVPSLYAVAEQGLWAFINVRLLLATMIVALFPVLIGKLLDHVPRIRQPLVVPKDLPSFHQTAPPEDNLPGNADPAANTHSRGS